MAGTLKPIPSNARNRLFVLLHKDVVRGVFLSFEAAGIFADEHQLSLDHLLEFQTRSAHPDHLHLMSAKFTGREEWRFLGEWTEANLPKEENPVALSLEHYVVRKDRVEHFRACEFPWEPDLFRQVNPMAENPLPAAPEPLPMPRKTPSKVDRHPDPTPIHRRKLPRDDASKPTPIPSFQPIGQPATTSGAYSPPPTEKEASARAGKPDPILPEDDPQDPQANLRFSLMPFPLVLALLVFLGGSTWGLLRVINAEPAPAEVADDIAALRNARTFAIAPDMLFFQMPVEADHQERYIRNLGLNPIPYDETVVLPLDSALTTWEDTYDSTAGAPSAWEEVEVWWEPRHAEISYGFHREWPDGSQLLLDLEGNQLSGWIRTDYLRELFE